MDTQLEPTRMSRSTANRAQNVADELLLIFEAKLGNALRPDQVRTLQYIALSLRMVFCMARQLACPSTNDCAKSMNETLSWPSRSKLNLSLQPVMEAGLDSLGAIEMQQLIMQHFQVQIPSTFIFDNPTIGSMTTYLMALMLPSAPNATLSRIGPQPQSIDIKIRNWMTRLVGISCRFPKGVCMYTIVARHNLQLVYGHCILRIDTASRSP